MKIFQETITVETRKVFDFVNLDEKIQEAVEKSKVKNGFVLLRSPHNTATIVCNEDDQLVLDDLKRVMLSLTPESLGLKHSYEGIDNARAHQIVSLLGHSHWLPIRDGKISLGTWQSIFMIELFEARRRRVEVMIVGES
jgi:secondary thiamine-phosphate synthase enzyme